MTVRKNPNYRNRKGISSCLRGRGATRRAQRITEPTKVLYDSGYMSPYTFQNPEVLRREADVDSAGATETWGAGHDWGEACGKSAPSASFCYEPKISLKTQVHLK